SYRRKRQSPATLPRRAKDRAHPSRSHNRSAGVEQSRRNVLQPRPRESGTTATRSTRHLARVRQSARPGNGARLARLLLREPGPARESVQFVSGSIVAGARRERRRRRNARANRYGQRQAKVRRETRSARGLPVGENPG